MPRVLLTLWMNLKIWVLKLEAWSWTSLNWPILVGRVWRWNNNFLCSGYIVTLCCYSWRMRLIFSDVIMFVSHLSHLTTRPTHAILKISLITHTSHFTWNKIGKENFNLCWNANLSACLDLLVSNIQFYFNWQSLENFWEIYQLHNSNLMTWLFLQDLLVYVFTNFLWSNERWVYMASDRT